MAYKPALNQFNGGEISPQLEGRIDWDKYNYSAKLCKNFIPIIEGSLKRRGGSHFVSLAKAIEYIIFSVKILGVTNNNTPKLIVNDKQYNLTQQDDAFIAGGIMVRDGDLITLSISCQGYYDITDSFYIDNSVIQKDYTLQEIQSGDVTLTVNKANEGISLTINGSDTPPFTMKAGTKIVWIASYNGYSNTGSFYIYEDTTKVLCIIDNIPVLTDNEIKKTSVPTEGTIMLGKGRYRLTLVGGGGGGYFLGDGITPRWYNGSSGGGIDIEVSLESGEYSWRCGDKQIDSWNTDSILPQGGSSSYLKFGEIVIAEAEKGSQNYGSGVVTVNNDYVVNKYLVQNGNYGGAESNFTGTSVLGSYGRGTQITGYSKLDEGYSINFIGNTTGYFAITYLGE